jgi:hypothetical protein
MRIEQIKKLGFLGHQLGKHGHRRRQKNALILTANATPPAAGPTVKIASRYSP